MDSCHTAWGSSITIATSACPPTAGRRWCRPTNQRDAPASRADRTHPASAPDRNSARTTRATAGQWVKPIEAMIASGSPRHIAAITMPITRCGKAFTPSTTRITTASIQPPAATEPTPISTPSPVATTAHTAAIVSEMRRPSAVRVSRSYPEWSVPPRWPMPGARNASPKSATVELESRGITTADVAMRISNNHGHCRRSGVA